ncbi:MAG TPA: metallophosphoesterase [Polyangiaceae bacterium]|nr:metallophosphoesterase [Polyangiaceae bacterium]
MSPFVILSDLHLDPGTHATAEACARLIAAHPGYEVVLSGDIFGLSEDPPSLTPQTSVQKTLAAHPELARAMRQHLLGGARLTWIAGNHDAGLTVPGMAETVLRSLDLPEAPLRIEPWFIRRGGVHIEHGHVWDADNAPVHPLGDWSLLTEPLGVALTRRFVSKHASHFAHAHETTLVQGLKRAFGLYGARAPLLILIYFGVAAGICLEALLQTEMDEERQQGAGRSRALAEECGISLESLQELLSALPTPTHTEFGSTFFRLYFDRVLLALLCGGAGVWSLARLSPIGLGVGVVSAAVLRHNVKRTGARYQNLPIRRLRHGAAIARSLMRADVVVFGHTHVPTCEDGYVNTGSFAYFDKQLGRPYVHVDGQAHLELRRFV